MLGSSNSADSTQYIYLPIANGPMPIAADDLRAGPVAQAILPLTLPLGLPNAFVPD